MGVRGWVYRVQATTIAYQRINVEKNESKAFCVRFGTLDSPAPFIAPPLGPVFPPFPHPSHFYSSVAISIRMLRLGLIFSKEKIKKKKKYQRVETI